MVISDESWMILAQCSWLLLFLLLLLFLCCLGLGLSLLVLLNQLIHLKKKKMLEQNKGNYLWDHKHIIMTFLFTWSAGRILIWVFPFSLKYWISAAIELDIMFFRQRLLWLIAPGESCQLNLFRSELGHVEGLAQNLRKSRFYSEFPLQVKPRVSDMVSYYAMAWLPLP